MAFRLVLTGVGAMNSPRYAPAGLLAEHDGTRVMFDGGRASSPDGGLDAWLVTDDRAELKKEIVDAARRLGAEPEVASFFTGGLRVDPKPVVHTSHPTFGYMIRADGARIAWAPEFWQFPTWARGVDLLFADAAGWNRPIHFAGKVGGHAAALDVAEESRRLGVARLVLAHIGRPTIKAIDAGRRPPFGEFGHDGRVFYPRRWPSS